MTHILIVGAGMFGVVSAIALRQRGHDVTLVDPGPLPHPLAASTDISKAIRMDYGADEDYMHWMETALDGWRRWNHDWGTTLFHEAGVTYLTRAPMQAGGFEYESYQRLVQRGHQPQRLDAAAIRQKFPAWSTGIYVDGYYNRFGGYAESGQVVARLLIDAQKIGVTLKAAVALKALHVVGAQVRGIVTTEGQTLLADDVLLALGAWTHHLLPELASMLRSNGMPVFHLKPENPAIFEETRFPAFGADISQTGYYGFPLHPINGVVKIANHGDGRLSHPEAADRAVTEAEMQHLRAFLQTTFPALATASIVFTRRCFYSDTWDGHFLIARHPDYNGLTIAAGDSGHGFKFAPVLGTLIADAIEGRAHPLLHKFRWRPEIHPTRTEEAARYQAAR